jgi:hypothetical protein
MKTQGFNAYPIFNLTVYGFSCVSVSHVMVLNFYLMQTALDVPARGMEGRGLPVPPQPSGGGGGEEEGRPHHQVREPQR